MGRYSVSILGVSEMRWTTQARWHATRERLYATQEGGRPTPGRVGIIMGRESKKSIWLASRQKGPYLLWRHYRENWRQSLWRFSREATKCTTTSTLFRMRLRVIVIGNKYIKWRGGLVIIGQHINLTLKQSMHFLYGKMLWNTMSNCFEVLRNLRLAQLW